MPMSLPELKDCILDHIAIAVKSIDTSKKFWEDMGLIFAPDKLEKEG